MASQVVLNFNVSTEKRQHQYPRQNERGNRNLLNLVLSGSRPYKQSPCVKLISALGGNEVILNLAEFRKKLQVWDTQKWIKLVTQTTSLNIAPYGYILLVYSNS